MIIVSDTTPVHYLILIDEIDLLPRLLGEIVIPEVVFRELQADRTPSKIKNYLRNKPSWLSVCQAPPVIDHQLDDIDPGERAAILLRKN
jgi:predicted nucleic acid-binding protein